MMKSEEPMYFGREHMKDFEGKVLKIYYDNVQGWVSGTGYFIKKEGNFIVIRENVSNKIKYINENYIKSIEIVGDVYDK